MLYVLQHVKFRYTILASTHHIIIETSTYFLLMLFLCKKTVFGKLGKIISNYLKTTSNDIYLVAQIFTV